MNIRKGLAAAAVTLVCAVLAGVSVLLITAASVYFGPLGFLVVMIFTLCVLAFIIGALS